MRDLWRVATSRRDLASCLRVIRELDAYLDGEIADRLTSVRIASHLDICRRCGLEAQVLADLKAGLRRLAPAVDSGTMDRLRRFARRLERD